MLTVGEVINRVKEGIKAVTNDSFITDRYVFSLLHKYSALVIRQQDNRNKLKLFTPMYQSLVIRLEEVDRVKDNCFKLKSGCTIKRSEVEFTDLIEGYNGPLIKSVRSIDGSIELVPTTPTKYNSIKSSKLAKYDKSVYYFFENNRFYFPDLEWDEVEVEIAGLWDLSLLGFCYSKKNNKLPECISIQDQKFYLPEALLANVEQMIMQELGNRLKVPPDQNPDKQSLNRD